MTETRDETEKVADAALWGRFLRRFRWPWLAMLLALLGPFLLSPFFDVTRLRRADEGDARIITAAIALVTGWVILVDELLGKRARLRIASKPPFHPLTTAALTCFVITTVFIIYGLYSAPNKAGGSETVDCATRWCHLWMSLVPLAIAIILLLRRRMIGSAWRGGAVGLPVAVVNDAGSDIASDPVHGQIFNRLLWSWVVPLPLLVAPFFLILYLRDARSEAMLVVIPCAAVVAASLIVFDDRLRKIAGLGTARKRPFHPLAIAALTSFLVALDLVLYGAFARQSAGYGDAFTMIECSNGRCATTISVLPSAIAVICSLAALHLLMGSARRRGAVTSAILCCASLCLILVGIIRSRW